jgi:hypothetical protein
MLNKFRVRIVMPDGSSGIHYGLYAHVCDAIVLALSAFPQAMCISAIRLP